MCSLFCKECYGYNRKFTPELDGHAGGAVKVTSEEECQKRCFETVGCGHWAAWLKPDRHESITPLSHVASCGCPGLCI